MPNISTLAEAISQAIKCNNRLFERCQNKRHIQQISIPLPPPTMLTLSTYFINSNYKLMQIDSIRYKPLTQDEEDCRRYEGLCLYCGDEGHLACDCKKNEDII